MSDRTYMSFMPTHTQGKARQGMDDPLQGQRLDRRGGVAEVSVFSRDPLWLFVFELEVYSILERNKILVFKGFIRIKLQFDRSYLSPLEGREDTFIMESIPRLLKM